MRGRGCAAVILDRARGEKFVPPTSGIKTEKQESRWEQEGRVPELSRRASGSWDVRAWRILEPLALTQSSCLLVRPAVIARGSTRLQRCRDETVTANIYEALCSGVHLNTVHGRLHGNLEAGSVILFPK